MWGGLMHFPDFKVGMVLDLRCQRCYDFAETARVEFIASDWAVIRTDSGQAYLVRPDDGEFHELVKS